jgi:hypothetical protein
MKEITMTRPLTSRGLLQQKECMMLHKLRIALAATIVALAAVSAVDSAWAIENIRVNGLLLPYIEQDNIFREVRGIALP